MKAKLGKLLCVLVLGLAICLPGSAKAAYVTYTSEASFLSNIPVGYYLENFTGVKFGDFYPATSQSYSGNGFSYDIASSDGLFGVPDAISVAFTTNTLVTTKTGSKPIYAMGGQFFNTNVNGDDVRGTSLTVTFSPLGLTQEVSYPLVTRLRPFFGVISDVPLTSFSLVSDGEESHYPTIDRLYVAIPIPASVLLLGSGLLGLGLLGWRRKSG